MSSEIMQETTPLVECSAFHRGMSVLEASLRNTEDSEAIISGLLKGAAEFYGASRASVVEADWDLGIGIITYEWCKDGVSAQRDMLQCLPMEKFPRWRKALRANKPVVISDLQRLEKVYTAHTIREFLTLFTVWIAQRLFNICNANRFVKIISNGHSIKRLIKRGKKLFIFHKQLSSFFCHLLI